MMIRILKVALLPIYNASNAQGPKNGLALCGALANKKNNWGISYFLVENTNDPFGQKSVKLPGIKNKNLLILNHLL